MIARVRPPPRLLEVPANVLTVLAVGLTIWLCLGVLVAQLFGASLIPSFSLDMKESAGRRGDSGKNRRSAGGGISLRIRPATFAAA